MHATMAIFNAWCGRAPVFMLGATGPGDAEERRPWIDWIHTSKDQGALIRHYTKWDDEPRSVGATLEAMLRAWQISSTEPRGPIYMCYDAALQEAKLEKDIPLPPPHAVPTPSPMMPDPRAN